MSWGYDRENGPDTWAQNFAAAAGSRQSPVDINTNLAVEDNNLKTTPLTISYNQERSLHLENTGHGFKANITADSSIRGGPLGKDVYKLVQFHFHWGPDDSSGSEHTVNGKMYPSELHLVHYNSSKYKNFAEAVSQSDGLAVIGVFIKVGPKAHEGFNVLSDNAPNVKCKGGKYDTGLTFNPSVLLPGNTSSYWTYEGSLTTPPCNECVTWIVLKEEISISAHQMNALRHLCCDDCGSKPISVNYRPPLPLGTRRIRASFKN